MFAVVVKSTVVTPDSEETHHSIYSLAVTTDCNMRPVGERNSDTNATHSGDKWRCARVYYTETQARNRQFVLKQALFLCSICVVF